MKIFLTRHGKTKWNKEGRFQGTKNSELVDDGIRDAKYLKDYINNHITVNKVYSSPIKRAKDTTNILFSKSDIPIIYDKRIQEMNFGDWEGKLIQEITAKDPDLYHDLWNHPDRFKGCPNGENYHQLEKRVSDFINQILLQNKDDQSIFIVTHGMIYVVMMAFFKGLSQKDYPLINKKVVRGCSLTTIKYINNQFEIQNEGDESFLIKDKVIAYQ